MFLRFHSVLALYLAWLTNRFALVEANSNPSDTSLCFFEAADNNGQSRWLISPLNYINNEAALAIQSYPDSDLSKSTFYYINFMYGGPYYGYIYLYNNDEREGSENVAFVAYNETAYHFSGVNMFSGQYLTDIDYNKYQIVKGSCIEGQYQWPWTPDSTAVAARTSYQGSYTYIMNTGVSN
ncbi:hypothetical protein V1522DRAFT_432308 [Lipomyces starkeyi]